MKEMFIPLSITLLCFMLEYLFLAACSSNMLSQPEFHFKHKRFEIFCLFG